MVIGLVSLLMISSISISELIIKNMQSVRRIEASNRAYLAAEAGIEDALYELAPHFAGYQTYGSRSADFKTALSGNTDWENEWEIVSRNDYDPASTAYEGELHEYQKLIISFFNDANNAEISGNAINTTADSEDIGAFLPDFSITFSIPGGAEIILNNNFPQIDNDGDFNGEWGTVNEDGPGIGASKNNPFCLENPEDADCDGRVDEDSPEDPVILWKLTDGGSRSLIPIRGCLGYAGGGSELCEKNFFLSYQNQYSIGAFSVKMDKTVPGLNELGRIETIEEFIDRALDPLSDPPGDPTAKLHFEFLVIAPLEHVDSGTLRKIEIPYIAYKIEQLNPGNEDSIIPFPYFEIKSDGYYGTFKQSITTYVTPKTTVPLFDFTIIQQK